MVYTCVWILLSFVGTAAQDNLDIVQKTLLGGQGSVLEEQRSQENNKSLLDESTSSLEYSMLFIVRTYDPKPGMLERFRAYDADLKLNMARTKFMISIDTTKTDNAVTLVRNATPDTLLHVYNWTSITDAYPVLRDMPCNPSPYFMHTEPVVVAWEYARVNSNMAADASVVVFEDDVVACGGASALSGILKHFQTISYDMLSSDIPYKANDESKSLAEAFYGTCSSRAYFQRYNASSVWKSAEYVNGFSNKFLEHTQALLLRGMHAQSERFTATICANDGFECKTVPEETRGTVWSYKPGNNLNRTDAQAACSTEGTPKLLHPGKF